MRKHTFSAICLTTLFLLPAGLATACGSRQPPPEQASTPVRDSIPLDFAADTLEWGMSLQEFLDAMEISSADVTTEEKRIPASSNLNATIAAEVTCDRFAFQGIPLNATFTFRAQDTDPPMELGLTRIYVGLCEDSLDTFYELRDHIDSGPLSFFLDREALTAPQQEALDAFHAVAYKTSTDDLPQMDICAVGGAGVSDGTDGIYYYYRLDGIEPAVLNRSEKGR